MFLQHFYEPVSKKYILMINFKTNVLVAATEDSTLLLIQKPGTGHNPKPFPSTSDTTNFPPIHINVILPPSSQSQSGE
jgi:hypothetical protein